LPSPWLDAVVVAVAAGTAVLLLPLVSLVRLPVLAARVFHLPRPVQHR
jgi:hypothetical protein